MIYIKHRVVKLWILKIFNYAISIFYVQAICCVGQELINFINYDIYNMCRNELALNRPDSQEILIMMTSN